MSYSKQASSSSLPTPDYSENSSNPYHPSRSHLRSFLSMNAKENDYLTLLSPATSNSTHGHPRTPSQPRTPIHPHTPHHLNHHHHHHHHHHHPPPPTPVSSALLSEPLETLLSMKSSTQRTSSSSFSDLKQSLANTFASPRWQRKSNASLDDDEPFLKQNHENNIHPFQNKDASVQTTLNYSRKEPPSQVGISAETISRTTLNSPHPNFTTTPAAAAATTTTTTVTTTSSSSSSSTHFNDPTSLLAPFYTDHESTKDPFHSNFESSPPSPTYPALSTTLLESVGFPSTYHASPPDPPPPLHRIPSSSSRPSSPSKQHPPLPSSWNHSHASSFTPMIHGRSIYPSQTTSYTLTSLFSALLLHLHSTLQVGLLACSLGIKTFYYVLLLCTEFTLVPLLRCHWSTLLGFTTLVLLWWVDPSLLPAHREQNFDHVGQGGPGQDTMPRSMPSEDPPLYSTSIALPEATSFLKKTMPTTYSAIDLEAFFAHYLHQLHVLSSHVAMLESLAHPSLAQRSWHDVTLWMHGAQVTSASETYAYPTQWLGIPYQTQAHPPSMVLHSDQAPGHCWAARLPAHLTLRFSFPVVPKRLVWQHVSLAEVPTVRSAPKSFRIYDLTKTQVLLESEFRKPNRSQDSTQIFPFPATTANADFLLEGVHIQVDDNHGHPDYVCIYRIRIEGDPAHPDPDPASQCDRVQLGRPPLEESKPRE